MATERPIYEEVEQQLERMREEAEAAFGRGYAQGRKDQQDEDRYYIERVTELSRLLASAEAEIQRLRTR
jgi:hypothetical protein